MLAERNMYRIKSKIIERLKEQDFNVTDLLCEYMDRHKKSKIDYSKIIEVGKQLDKELIEIGDIPDTVNNLTDEEILTMLKRNRKIFKAHEEYGGKIKEILKVKRY